MQSHNELVRTLYKFTKLRAEFLENRYLRLTPRNELNDPFDTYPFPSDIAYILKSLKKRKKPKLKATADDVRREHFSGIGIVSLSESIHNSLMWAHYADSHKGMAIGLRREHEFWRGGLARVRYTTQRPALRDRYPKIRGAELWFKSDQWMYEKEWRLIRALQLADHLVEVGLGSIPMKKMKLPCVAPQLAMVIAPYDAIESITFGARVSASEMKSFKNITRRDPHLRHVELRQMTLDEDRYEMILKHV